MVASAVALPVSSEQREVLERLSRSHTAPAREVRQARALLWAAAGVPNAEIARRCESTPKSVRRWRARFDVEGLASVGHIRPGRGRRPVIDADTVAAIVHDTLHAVPEDGSVAWTTRTLGDRHGVGKDTVARIWRSRGLRPWKVDTFKLSTAPAFEDKLVDVVGLYVNPPAAAAVFCFDEKTQVQALDRTQPSLPMIPGRAGTMTHDYWRHGTTDLFAAMNVATGEVLHDTRRAHTGRDVLAFFGWIDAHVDPDLELHLIETWFSVLTRKALTNTSFTSVGELEARIDWWVSHRNDNPEPFVWTRTAEEIIDKVTRGRATLDRIINPATHH